MTIGEKIYELRTRKSMTQEQLANEMGVSRQAISKWESGSSIPELAKLKALAELFDVSMDELLGKDSVSSNGEADTEADEKLENKREQLDETKLLQQLESLNERIEKNEKTTRKVDYIQDIAVCIMALALIITNVNLSNANSEISQLSQQLLYLNEVYDEDDEAEVNSFLKEWDYDISGLDEEKLNYTLDFWCVPKSFTNETEITLNLTTDEGISYNQVLTENDGVYAGRLELPICNIEKILVLQNDGGTQQTEMLDVFLDLMGEVCPVFYMDMDLSTGAWKKDILSVDTYMSLSLVDEFGNVQEATKKHVTEMTVQLCSGRDTEIENPEILWECTLSKEQIAALNKDEKLRFPIQINEKTDSEYIYVRILFQHTMLEKKLIQNSGELGINESGNLIIEFSAGGCSVSFE